MSYRKVSYEDDKIHQALIDANRAELLDKPPKLRGSVRAAREAAWKGLNWPIGRKRRAATHSMAAKQSERLDVEYRLNHCRYCGEFPSPDQAIDIWEEDGVRFWRCKCHPEETQLWTVAVV